MRDLKTKVLEYNESLGGKSYCILKRSFWDVGGLPPTKRRTVDSAAKRRRKHLNQRSH
ncbi:hypothetical protein ACEQPO_06345 [Bacillus sp. SL00103]